MIRNETPEQDFKSGAEIRLTTLLSTFSLTRLSPSKLEVLALEMGSNCQIGIEISNYTDDKISVGVIRPSHI